MDDPRPAGVVVPLRPRPPIVPHLDEDLLDRLFAGMQAQILLAARPARPSGRLLPFSFVAPRRAG